MYPVASPANARDDGSYNAAIARIGAKCNKNSEENVNNTRATIPSRSCSQKVTGSAWQLPKSCQVSPRCCNQNSEENVKPRKSDDPKPTPKRDRFPTAASGQPLV
jgi:hypothetical protein